MTLVKKWDDRPDRYSHTHVHTLRGMSKEERQEWLDQALERAAEISNMPINVTIIEKDNGYEFNFENSQDYGFFMLATLGEQEGHRNHSHAHTFSDDQDDQEWMKAAQTYLDAMGVEYDVEYVDGEATFKFDKFSERMCFEALANDGQIDRLAEYGKDEEFEAQVKQYRDGIKPYCEQNFSRALG